MVDSLATRDSILCFYRAMPSRWYDLRHDSLASHELSSTKGDAGSCNMESPIWEVSSAAGHTSRWTLLRMAYVTLCGLTHHSIIFLYCKKAATIAFISVAISSTIGIDPICIWSTAFPGEDFGSIYTQVGFCSDLFPYCFYILCFFSCSPICARWVVFSK